MQSELWSGINRLNLWDVCKCASGSGGLGSHLSEEDGAEVQAGISEALH